jgi:hypothetical protein
MSDKKNTKRRRPTAAFWTTAEELKAIIDAGASSELAQDTNDRLTEMVGWMIEHTPEGGQLAADIYLAIALAWKAARADYGYENANHPTERGISALHGNLLITAQPEKHVGFSLRPSPAGDPTEDQDEVPEDIPAVNSPSAGAPQDLNLWRQSHPRTIKQCIVQCE